MQVSSWEEVNHRVYEENQGDDEQESQLVDEEENPPHALGILFALGETSSSLVRGVFCGEMLMASK